MFAFSFKNFPSNLSQLLTLYLGYGLSFQTPRVKCDLCLTNLDFGLSLSILGANESCSQHANKRNFLTSTLRVNESCSQHANKRNF